MIRALLFSFFAILLVVGVVIKTHFFANSSKISFLSPIPSYYQESLNLVKNLNIWRPNDKDILSSQVAKPEITTQSAIVYDLTTDTVIFEKNARERLPVASIVKIMTAVVALESKDPSVKMKVSKQAATIGENVMGISENEVYTLEELLYGLVLHSGNDAAEAIAEGVSGTSGAFVVEMNRKAQILGLSDTYFVNPSGLGEELSDGKEIYDEYSTASDLVTLTKYALTLPLFAKIAQTYEHHINYTSSHKELYLYNQTNLLTTYPGVKGVKTGYTPSAGLCLVTYAENGGHKLIGVVLNSQSRREEMRALLDYSFSSLGVSVSVGY